MKHFLISGILIMFFAQITIGQIASNNVIYLKVNDTVFARTIDIVKYDTVNHTFDFTTEKRLTFDALKIPVGGLPFAFFVNREKIYEGIIFSMESSVNCNCIVIYNLSSVADSALPPLQIMLGYPSEKFFTGTDKRNDKKIIDVLLKNKIAVK